MTLRLTKQLTIMNEERLSERLAGPHTIAVTGVARGGTSSVALVLREFGLFMGDAPIHFNHEDERLQEVRNEPEAFGKIVREYDERYPVWAFKLPVGTKMLRNLAPLLRAPILIAVSRSIPSVVRSRFARRGFDDQQVFLEGLASLYSEWQKLASAARKTDAPLILVEYEKLTADPPSFVTELIEVLGLEIPEEVRVRAADAVANPGYQRFSGDPDQSSLAKPAVERRLFR